MGVAPADGGSCLQPRPGLCLAVWPQRDKPPFQISVSPLVHWTNTRCLHSVTLQLLIFSLTSEWWKANVCWTDAKGVLSPALTVG